MLVFKINIDVFYKDFKQFTAKVADNQMKVGQ